MKAGVMLKTLGKVETLEAGACFPLVMETAIDAPLWGEAGGRSLPMLADFFHVFIPTCWIVLSSARRGRSTSITIPRVNKILPWAYLLASL